MKNESKETCSCGCSCGKKFLALSFTALISAGIAFGACHWCCCGTKAMVIDFDRVQQEARVYRSIIEAQKGYEEKIQAQLNLDGGRLQQEEKDLIEQKGKLSETEFKKKAVALQKKAVELDQKYRGQVQRVVIATQMAAKEARLKVEGVLNQVAERAGAGVVVYKASAPYTGDKCDLTDRFIEALNKSVKPVAYPDPEKIQPVVQGK